MSKAAKKPANLLTTWFDRAQASARLMCGVPDYETYVQHTRTNHPDRSVLSYEAFFQDRVEAKFARGVGRCC